jgi:hypothetical protein
MITSSNIHDIKSFVLPITSNAKPLALFDFDDTLVMTGSQEASHLGGIKWRDDFRKRVMALKASGQINENVPLFECASLFIAKSLTAKAVEGQKTAQLIQDLEEMGCQVMVFTARGRSGENAWYKLNVTGIDLMTKKQMQQAGISICQPSSDLVHPNIYDNCMILAQNRPKDQLLNDLFSSSILNKNNISQMLFVDDKKEQVEKVEKSANEHGMAYTGMHYTFIDEIEKQQYHPLKATIQLVSLLAHQVLLADSQVEEIVRKTSEDDINKVILELNQQLTSHQIYDQIGLDADRLFEKMKLAVSEHFAQMLS